MGTSVLGASQLSMCVLSTCSMCMAYCADERGMFRSERVRKVPEGRRTCTLVRTVTEEVGMM